jgi:hypothetical protein
MEKDSSAERIRPGTEGVRNTLGVVMKEEEFRHGPPQAYATLTDEEWRQLGPLHTSSPQDDRDKEILKRLDRIIELLEVIRG